MGSDDAEVVETLPTPSSFKVHHKMCTELMKMVDRIVNIFPEIETSRPRCSSGIQALCSLNDAVEKAKLLLQHCNESSKLYLAVTGDVMVSRCRKSRDLLGQSLGQIQTMVPVMLAVKICQIIDDLGTAIFSLDSMEEEAGKAVKELLKRSALPSESQEDTEMKALQLAASRLNITSSKAIVIEKRCIKRLLDKVGESDLPKRNVLKYLLYMLRKYGSSIIGDQKENDCCHHEGSLPSDRPVRASINSQPFQAISYSAGLQNDVQVEVPSRVVPPEEFKCPLSSRLMHDPVVISSGQTFERVFIQKWFDEGNATCPKTKNKLLHRSLTPNTVMKDLITKWYMKYGVNIPNPSDQSGAFRSLESSCTSIASLGSSMNELQLPSDVSILSLASLDDSCSSDVSHGKGGNGLAQTLKRTSDDIHNSETSFNVNEAYLVLSSLTELRWELQCQAIEDMLNHLKYDGRACYSFLWEDFCEPVITFLKSACDVCDLRAQRAGCLLLLAFLRNNRSGVQNPSEEALILLSYFLGSEVTKETLDIIEVLSGQTNCISTIVASGALAHILEILNSQISDFKEQVIRVLSILSSSKDACSALVDLESIPKLALLLHHETLARDCLIILKNLCNNSEASVAITKTPGCVSSVAELLETGSSEDQENAVAVLLSLCSQHVKYCQMIMDEGVIPALVLLANNGTNKGKAFALELLRVLRDVEYNEEQEYTEPGIVTPPDDTNSNSKEKKSPHKSPKIFGIKLSSLCKIASVTPKKQR